MILTVDQASLRNEKKDLKRFHDCVFLIFVFPQYKFLQEKCLQ